jgi:signal transduction protein with GAF and PtsI domain
MAGDPASAVLLMGMGIDTLSMAPSCIPAIKRALRAFSRQRARFLFAEAIGAENPSKVHSLLSEAFEDLGLRAAGPQIVGKR